MEIINYFIEAYKINPVGQIIGFIALGISIYNFTFCRDKKFIIFTAIASLAWGIHFLSLGLLAAALVNLFDVAKNIVALKYEKNKHWVIGFIFIYLLLGYVSFEGLFSIIPTLTAIISTLLVFYIRGIWLNIGFLFVVALWMVYNYFGQSIGGLATDSFLLVSGIINISRQLINSKKICLENNG